MRNLLVPCFMAICSFTFAQQKPQLKLYVPNSEDITALERLGKLNQSTKPVEGLFYPREQKIFNGFNLDNEPKYLGTNELGDIYALPNSGMPWLKPKDNAADQNKLPVVKLSVSDSLNQKAGEIPNALKRKKPLLKE